MSVKCIEKNISQRAEVYLCLSQLFSEPDSALYDNLNKMESVIASVFPSLIESFNEIQKSVSAFNNNFSEILVAYSALFIGPFETISPPFSSIYLDEGILMGDSAMTVMDCYISIGMEVNPGISVENLPDHISVELEFLHHCLSKYQETSDESFYQLAYAFIDSHLMRWLPDFTKRIIEGSGHTFYQKLGMFLMRYIEEDINFYFSDIISD